VSGRLFTPIVAWTSRPAAKGPIWSRRRARVGLETRAAAIYGALRAGASGFLVKDMALEDILTAIRVVAAGDAIIAPGVTRRLIGQFARQPRPDPKPPGLTGITGREREVLKLVGLGMSNAEIAAALYITYITAGTAKTHVARLLAKLGARDRVQLVITAYEAGLLDT
jgi:DNA-binding NarL/FixJ family response regulator